MGGDGTVRCPACAREVPIGAYCGNCGADLTAKIGDGRGRLRVREYVAEPRESLLRFAPPSTLFPQLPARSRRPFWFGLLVLVAVLVGFAVAGWQAPLIATCVLGFPSVVLAYLRHVDAARDLSTRWLLVTAGVGIALGVVWGLIGGAIVANGSDVGLDTGLTRGSVLLLGLTIPVAGALLMLVPALLARVARSGDREPLDGFTIGLLGATAFTAATTMARLAPQLATGPLTDGQPLSATLVEAGIRGFAMPLTAAATGGFVGIALWFDGRRDGHDRGPAPRIVGPAILLTMLLYAAMGLSELIRVPDDIHLVLHLAVSAVALSVLRIAIQAAVLGETHREAPAGPVLCAHCDHIVPGMPFCPCCGVATAATSRSSREARRAGPPGAGDGDAGGSGSQPRSHPGYALAPGSYAAVPVPRVRPWRIPVMVGLGMGVAAALAFSLSVAISPTGQVYNCPPDCGRPPMGVPVAANPRFFAANGEFSVSYPAPGSAYRVDTDPNGVVLDYTAGDKGTMELFGQPAMGRSPRQIVDGLLKRSYPDAVIKYEIPNATVGYQLGYGAAADVFPQDPDSRFTRLRVIVLAAIKNDYALVASAVGPFRRFSRDFGPGHPSGANLELAMDMGKYVNSFMWRGDPPR